MSLLQLLKERIDKLHTMHDILRNNSIMEEKEYIIFHSTLTPLEGGGPLGRSSPFVLQTVNLIWNCKSEKRNFI